MLGLTAAPAPTHVDLDAVVGAVLDQRLQPSHARPIAVALSGGGDSLALLLVAAAWAKRRRRRLVVLTVDHRLRPQSAAWTDACATTAERLGADFQALAWTGDKPATGLPAAAREARHRLLADAAREDGARVILIGHTHDDVLEARRMRAEGGATPEPHEWSPSPAWPQGRGLFLLRPLLGLGRAEIRNWLAARGESWIEDPANDDPRFARARARRGAGRPSAPPQAASAASLARACLATPEGGLAIPRQRLRDEPEAAGRFLAAACLCAAGTRQPPAADNVQRLSRRMLGEGDVVATLAGARIEADGQDVRIRREAGEAARGGLQPLNLAPGEAAVWDGRFEIVADRPMEIRRLAGLSRRLPRPQRAALRALPPSARGGLPVVVEADGAISCPILAGVPGVSARALALERLMAACGGVTSEPQ